MPDNTPPASVATEATLGVNTESMDQDQQAKAIKYCSPPPASWIPTMFPCLTGHECVETKMASSTTLYLEIGAGIVLMIIIVLIVYFSTNKLHEYYHANAIKSNMNLNVPCEAAGLILFERYVDLPGDFFNQSPIAAKRGLWESTGLQSEDIDIFTYYSYIEKIGDRDTMLYVEFLKADREDISSRRHLFKWTITKKFETLSCQTCGDTHHRRWVRTKWLAPEKEDYVYLDPVRFPIELPGLCLHVRIALRNDPSLLNRVRLAAAFAINFLYIHPFSNGNGWVARIAVSWLLEGHTVVPVPLSGDRVVYLDCVGESKVQPYIP
ncbi:hypothetical protein BDK51DRAFT_50933 [Blyttiomyces helicus]|uniref:Fido domain-containing protein n=1 Tax=Blyttiomyces helicus TaxID=388810 RepID=A0A4P9WLW2_9FUNG|nr:hypothetical protein BDK51DRAFT_50933 [Blyttiomyces helicus]|eukprot:RKO94041.1 hypothetical protein BDK51DRAFT_50933 [Blyttiomyces helicus]